MDVALRSLAMESHDGLHTPAAFDLVAYLPCPIKVPFEEAIGGYLASMDVRDPRMLIEGNANKSEADYLALVTARSARDLPSILITPGVNQLYGPRFMSEIVDSGAFVDVASYPHLPNESLRDPRGHATVIAANVTVIVVDHTHLGERQLPQKWADLQSPEWVRSVIMRGNGKTFCETTLLAWWHLFGADGLRAIGRSIREGMHPAQMAKLAGTGHEQGAAIYVMPYFFARNIVRKDRVTIVWPEPVVIASPVTMLAKKDSPQWVMQLARWLAGPTIARMFSLAGLPTPHPEVSPGLPVDPRYVWSGWERARSSDLSAELSLSEAAFASGHLSPV